VQKLLQTYIKLNLTDLRSLCDTLLERISKGDLLHPLSELGEELVVDTLLHEDSGPGTTGLPVVPASTANKIFRKKTKEERKERTKHHE
jgi:hypothetical protein